MMNVATFSIVAFDPADKAWGIAVASKFPAVGAVVPWASVVGGAVATQSYANTSFGPRGLDIMKSGHSAQEAMDILLKADEGRETRQVGLVDVNGTPATFTGTECLSWAGGITGDSFAAQGNILTGPETVDAMAAAFLETEGDLPARLMAALLAGDQTGGDRRGRQSAALLVVKAEGGYGGFNDRWIDYRVDDDPHPVIRLEKLLQLHRLYFGKSPEEDELVIEGEVAQKLQTIMTNLGYYTGPISGRYDGATQKALRNFIGNENFEDRTAFKAGRIDRPVFQYLLQKFES